MANIILGCDSNGVNDKKCRDTVAKILKKAGHTVEVLPIAPGPFADASYSKSNKGKIGVYLIAAGITSIADAYDGNISFKYTYFGIRGDLGNSRMSSMKDFKTKPISKDKHGDCISKSCNKLAGKTFPQMNEIIKSKCNVTFGTTPEEIGNNLVKAIGGSNNINSSSDKDSVSSIKEALKEVLSGWDGDVECFVREDTVYVRKIKDPSTAKLEIIEFENVIYDSVSVTDVNPSTVNSLKVNYKNRVIVIEDKNLQKRFGKIESQVSASNVKSMKEAESFARTEWNKLRRNNGHILEVKVIGHTKWKAGAWCRVYLPSFSIDDYMYITKMSQEDSDGDWICSLTLRDYPPSLGEPKKESGEENTK